MDYAFAAFRARQGRLSNARCIFFSGGIRLRPNGVTVARQLPIHTGIHLRNGRKTVRPEKDCFSFSKMGVNIVRMFRKCKRIMVKVMETRMHVAFWDRKPNRIPAERTRMRTRHGNPSLDFYAPHFCGKTNECFFRKCAAEGRNASGKANRNPALGCCERRPGCQEKRRTPIE